MCHETYDDSDLIDADMKDAQLQQQQYIRKLSAVPLSSLCLQQDQKIPNR